MTESLEQTPGLLTRLQTENDFVVDVARQGVHQLLQCVREVGGTFQLSMEDAGSAIALTVRDGMVQEAQLGDALSDVDRALEALHARTDGMLRVRRVAEPPRKMIFGPNTTQALASIADAPSVVAHAERTLQREVPDLVTASSRPPPAVRKSKMQTRLGVGAPPPPDTGTASKVSGSKPPPKKMSTQIGVGAPPVPSVRTPSKVKTKLGLERSTTDERSGDAISDPSMEELPLALADTLDMEDFEEDIVGDLAVEPRADDEPLIEPPDISGALSPISDPAAPPAALVPDTRPPAPMPSPEPQALSEDVASAVREPQLDQPMSQPAPSGPPRRSSSLVASLAVVAVVLLALAALGFVAWRGTGSTPTEVAEAPESPAEEVEARVDPQPEVDPTSEEQTESAAPPEAVAAPEESSGSQVAAAPSATASGADQGAPPGESDPRRALGLAADAPAVDVSNALVSQGRRARRDHDLAAAERHFRQAIEVAEFNPRAHAGLAGLLYRSSRADEAVAPARRAVELGPTRASYHVLLGDVLDARGQTEEAAEHWKKAHDLRPDARVRVRLRGAGVQISAP